MCLCMLVCMNFRDEILLSGEAVKPGKIRNNQKWQNDNNNNNNNNNFQEWFKKPRKFSISQMMKRTATLNSSREI